MSKILKLTLLSLFIGVLSAILSSSFLYSLSWVTQIRQNDSLFIWGLPLFGFIFGLIIKRLPHHINQGVPYLLSEIDNPQAHVSPWMAPFIFLSSLGTHLFGGSAGREGVGVIMGASAAHCLPRFNLSYQNLRPYLVYSGIAAGFSSLFGTPLTAIIFAFELHRWKDIKRPHLLTMTSLSSLAGFFMTHYLGPQHQRFEVHFSYTHDTLLYVIIAALTSGVGAHLFYWGIKHYTKFISQLFPKIEWKLFFGAFLISGFVFITDSYPYIGIGTDLIARSFSEAMHLKDFLLKCLLTIMTLAIGFKGGEVTPLFCMGSTLSNSTANFFNLKNFPLSSSLGMVSLFGAVTGTPLASAVMGAELFGLEVGMLSFFSCYLSRLIMGHRSIYRH